MKSILVIFSTIPLIFGSLEPASYKPPGQRLLGPPPTSYLPPEDTFSPSKLYLAPSSPTPALSRQYLLPETPIPTTEYLLDETAVSSLPLRNYVPASSLLAPHTSGPQRQQFGRRPSNAYLVPPAKTKSFDFSTPLPLATSARTPVGQYLGPATTSKFAGYQYGARDNALGHVAKPAKYNFQYRVNDNYGNDYSHQETRDGDSAWGMFSVLLPDGRRQIVHYDADANGYRPRITYEEPLGKVNQYPKSGPY